jgi:hypothetical protein
MEKTEFDALVAKVGTDVATKIKEVADPLQKRLDDFEQKTVAGLATAKDASDLKLQIEANDKALKDILKLQGETITELQNALNTEKEDEGETVIDMLTSQKDKIKEVFDAGTGQVSFRIGYKVGKNGKYRLVAKAADVHNTSTAGANASITQDLSDAAILRAGSEGDTIETVNRNRPWILDFVSVGATTSSTVTWFDEVGKQGDFAVTAEGAIKPLVMYTFNRTSADYQKVAGRAKITEEFSMDFPRLVSTIRDLMQVDCRNEMNDVILADLIANATAYSNPDLVGQIDNADNYAAIAAIAGQIGNSFHTPNVLVMNNNQGIVSATLKGTDGQYINPANVLAEINAAGLKMVKNPGVDFDHVFVGDGSVYKVLLRGDLVIRVGYSNDDFDRNQYSLVVEQYFYSYISQAKKAGLVYASLTDVKASIEKP